MKKDNLHTGTDAREKLIAGIAKVADAVGSTMGTGGANAVIEMVESPGHILTNDGYSIASNIRLADPIEEMGRKILMEAISRANKASGDGSSTTTVLTRAILEEGTKHLSESSPMELKRSLDACVPIIEAAVEAQKREIVVGDVGRVVAVSAEDAAVGALIQEIYEQIGKDGIIHWDVSKTTEDTYTLGSGITINGAGFVSPYMADIDEKSGQFLNQAKWKNARVLIVRQKVTSASEFNDLFAELYAKEIKEVVVFCDEIEAPVIPDLIRTRAARGFKTLVVKMPVIWKDQWYEDLARATGAVIIDPTFGITLKTMKLEHLGKVGHITVTKDDTFLDGIADMTEYVQALDAEDTDDSKLRAARLNTRTARLFIGAQSDSALSYKRLKIEDAIAAGWHALQNGIVPGGGSALVIASRSLPDTIGGRILKVALLAPAQQIVRNVMCDGVHRVADYEPDCGLDTRTREVVNMYDAGITDPTNIVLNAVKNAISVAAAVLTANTIVTFPQEESSITIPQ